MYLRYRTQKAQKKKIGTVCRMEKHSSFRSDWEAAVSNDKIETKSYDKVINILLINVLEPNL